MPKIKLTKTELHDVDVISSFIMDDIRNILVHYQKYCPDWNNDDKHYNMDDKMYASIHDDLSTEWLRRKADKVSTNQ
jgi:hypothetical protein